MSTGAPGAGADRPHRATIIAVTPAPTALDHPLPRASSARVPTGAPAVWPELLSALPSIVIGVLWAVYATWSSAAELLTFNSTSRDIGVYLQLLWNTAHGRPFQITVLESNRVHLAEHVALLAPVLAPIYAVVPDARWLFAGQTAALALAAIPVYLLARRLLGGTLLPTLFVAAYFAMPTLTEIAYDAFYPVTWTALPIGFAAYFLLTGRARAGTALAVLSLPIEEQGGLAVLGLGLFLLLRPGWRRLGGALFGLAALWLALIALVVMPRFHEPSTLPATGENRTIDHFHQLLTSPAAVFQDFALQRAPVAARWLLAPTGGLALLAPQVLVMDAPQAATLLLADKEGRFRRHWAAAMLPTIWLATVVGFASLKRQLRAAGVVLLIAGTVTCYLLDSNLPGGGDYDPADLTWSDRSEQMAYLVDRVPPGVSVGASRRVLSQLADRTELYVFPPSYAGKLWPPERRVQAYLLDLTNDGTYEALAGRQSPLRASRPYALWLAGDAGLLLLDRAPEPRTLVDREVGGVVLHGLDARAVDGSGYELEAFWQLPAKIAEPRQRVVRLLDASGAVLAEQVGLPTDDLFPIQEWPAGQILVERARMAVEQGIPAQLEIGWLAPDGHADTTTLPLAPANR